MSEKAERRTIIIDKDLWTKFRVHAIRQGKTASKLLRELMEKECNTPAH
jgi:hypothetical protein